MISRVFWWRSSWVCGFAGLLAIAGAVGGVGCAESPPTQSDPTTKAMSEPMNWHPDFSHDNISGGGLMDFDKDAFNRDLGNSARP